MHRWSGMRDGYHRRDTGWFSKFCLSPSWVKLLLSLASASTVRHGTQSIFKEVLWPVSVVFFKMKRDGALSGVHRMCPIKLSFCLLIRVDAPYWYLKSAKKKMVLLLQRCQAEYGTYVSFGVRKTWVWTSDRLFASCESLEKSLYFSEPHITLLTKYP